MQAHELHGNEIKHAWAGQLAFLARAMRDVKLHVCGSGKRHIVEFYWHNFCLTSSLHASSRSYLKRIIIHYSLKIAR
jgi:hypothetical protein